MIDFSNNELAHLNDAAIFRTKISVKQKFYQLFGEMIERLKQELQESSFTFPLGSDIEVGKISQGENYLGCPYVMADFPRLFDKTGVFALRTFAWWGHGITQSWHFSGKYFDTFQIQIIQAYPLLKHTDFYINTQTEWDYHMDDKNTISIKNLTEIEFKTLIQSTSFVKIIRTVKFEALVGFHEESVAFLHLMLRGLMTK